MSRFSLSFFPWHCHLYTQIFILWKCFRAGKKVCNFDENRIFLSLTLFCASVSVYPFYGYTQWKWMLWVSMWLHKWRKENMKVTKPICLERLYDNNNHHGSSSSSMRKEKCGLRLCTTTHSFEYSNKNSFINISATHKIYTMQNERMPYLMVLCFSAFHTLTSLAVLHIKHILSNKRNFLIHKLFQNIYQQHEMEIPIHLFRVCVCCVWCACVDSFKAIYIFWQWQKNGVEKKKWNVGNRKMISWILDCLSAREHAFHMKWLKCGIHSFMFVWEPSEEKKAKKHQIQMFELVKNY